MAAIFMFNFQLVRFLLVITGFWVTGSVINGQDPATHAATLTIAYAGVEVQRANTQAWLSLQPGAVMPFGPGDRVRTNASGRVQIEFWEMATLLLLPHSQFELYHLTVTGGGNELNARIRGTAIHELATPGDLANYRLELNDSVITQPAQHFAIWSSLDQVDAVAVSAGQLILETAETPITLEANQGWQAATIPIVLDSPLNAAALAAFHEGCSGEIVISEHELRVRAGPGEGFVVIGTLADGTTIDILGINDSRGWYRIRLDSHFGWVEALAVQSDCHNLRQFPDHTIEMFIQVLNATNHEQTLLVPFFWSPAR